MYSPKSYQISQDNVDAESHKQDEENHVDVVFDREIFFRFEFSYSLNKHAE